MAAFPKKFVWIDHVKSNLFWNETLVDLRMLYLLYIWEKNEIKRVAIH